MRVCWRLSFVLHPDPRGSSDTYAASNVKSYVYTNSDKYICTYRHAGSNPDADSIPYSYTHSGSNSYPNPGADAHTYCHSYTHSLPDSRGQAQFRSTQAVADSRHGA